jgi:hypothetical protein
MFMGCQLIIKSLTTFDPYGVEVRDSFISFIGHQLIGLAHIFKASI